MENSAPPNDLPTVAYEGIGLHRPYQAAPGSRPRRPFARTTSSPAISLPIAASLPVAPSLLARTPPLASPALLAEEEEREEEEEEEKEEEEDDETRLGDSDLPVEGSAFGRQESVTRRRERLGTGVKLRVNSEAEEAIMGPARAVAREPAGGVRRAARVFRTRVSGIFRSMKPSASESSLRGKIGAPILIHQPPSQVPDQTTARLTRPVLPPLPPHDPSAFKIARKPVPRSLLAQPYPPRGSSLAYQDSSLTNAKQLADRPAGTTAVSVREDTEDFDDTGGSDGGEN